MSYWSVARTETQRERTALEHLQRRGFTPYLPLTYGRSRAAAPLFPGYIFVAIEACWYPINATPGIMQLLLAGDAPARLPDSVMLELRAREDRKGVIALPRHAPLVGARVRITRGTMRDHVGTYDGAGTQHRLRVLLTLFGRSCSVDVPAAWLAFE